MARYASRVDTSPGLSQSSVCAAYQLAAAATGPESPDLATSRCTEYYLSTHASLASDLGLRWFSWLRLRSVWNDHDLPHRK
ncbi:hypothetical protein B0H11DRAFT_2229625 [Mycena galericulata]|nr:hypothetical protein B0H11DRAFT_2259113 [Mycena galericulata]KAJ7435388.1 hypothetical protein B0H11DRAFT_2257347 [Mycena galericulata]KAJ7490111.1 hypothetical protein B0H11DRAFT_2229625 [Mycena galericulata]